ncbi:MAG: hypothetical protein PHU71_02570 [Candidatus Gracilibacteria bacterium]|nr:hypothetical protein [Candidatus Gracilibacteria bacterium]
MPRRIRDRFSETDKIRGFSASPASSNIRDIIYNIGKNPKPIPEPSPEKASLFNKIKELLVEQRAFKEICELVKADPAFSKVGHGDISRALNSMDNVQREKTSDGTVLFSINN